MRPNCGSCASARRSTVPLPGRRRGVKVVQRLRPFAHEPRWSLAGQVKWDGGDDDFRQWPERPPKPGRSLVVEDAVPPVPDHDLREDHGQGQVGAQAMQGPDAVDHGATIARCGETITSSGK